MLQDLSPQLIGAVALAIMMVLIFARMWVGFVMMLIGIVGIGLLSSWDNAFSLAGGFAYTKSADYTMSCIPLFIFMGCTLYHTGLGQDLYYAARAWLSNLKGGLAMATVVACGFFAAICGDSTANTVTMGRVSYPEMRRHGYDEKISSCAISAGGTIGIMIPPSVPFIIYGVMTETSIGKLFMAGLIPGILQVIFYIVTVYIWGRVSKTVAPEGFKTTFEEKKKATKPVWPVLVIFVGMMAGLYGGLFTPTEAGAFCAFFTLVVTLITRKLKKDNFIASVKEGLQNTCMVFLIVLGAYFFTRFMVLTELPQTLSTSIVALNTEHNVPTFAIIGIIIVFYLFLGCFVDMLAGLLLTIPIIFPIITGLGLDPIWWGVLMVRIMEISMITPPVGLNLFVLAKTVKLPMKTVYKGIWPFLVADVIHLILLMSIPAISLWLPSHM